MSHQLNLARFTKPTSNEAKYASSRIHNSILCPYCLEYFSPQGFGNHIKTHQLDPTARAVLAKPGRVKLYDVAPTVNNSSSNLESTDGNASGLNVDGVMQNNNDGDVETDYVADADNGFEVRG